ncbi:hypothetical protein DLAC_05264 [Tieghemostelium lacteum]|uniref:Uncharacterized protein n=1 Tax=Tieghemostelium lacteum TaxID=361077 RepID=A0A151ZJ37_TIELA|nr:hypothetical protein DLAC_05264 [Tieghemostelium lacteum]|eukprot:KYQ93864.1 hypothetical protein DLAC_05264 [Tieghemostelium lacteum]
MDYLHCIPTLQALADDKDITDYLASIKFIITCNPSYIYRNGLVTKLSDLEEHKDLVIDLLKKRVKTIYVSSNNLPMSLVVKVLHNFSGNKKQIFDFKAWESIPTIINTFNSPIESEKREFISQVIYIIQTLNENMLSTVSIIKPLFQYTSIHLSKDEIYRFSNEYCKLLPIIFYNLSQPTVFEEYFGKIEVCKWCINYLIEWKEHPISLVGMINYLLAAQPTILQSNLTTIFNHLLATSLDKRFLVKENCILALTNLIRFYPNSISKSMKSKLLQHLVTEEKILSINYNAPYISNLYFELLIIDPEFTMDNFDMILKKHKESHNMDTSVCILNRLICYPIIFSALTQSKHFNKYHQKINWIANCSGSNRIYLMEYLMKFSVDGKQLLSMLPMVKKGIDKNSSQNQMMGFYLNAFEYIKCALKSRPNQNQVKILNEMYNDLLELFVISFDFKTGISFYNNSNLTPESILPYLLDRKDKITTFFTKLTQIDSIISFIKFLIDSLNEIQQYGGYSFILELLDSMKGSVLYFTEVVLAIKNSLNLDDYIQNYYINNDVIINSKLIMDTLPYITNNVDQYIKKFIEKYSKTPLNLKEFNQNLHLIISKTMILEDHHISDILMYLVRLIIKKESQLKLESEEDIKILLLYLKFITKNSFNGDIEFKSEVTKYYQSLRKSNQRQWDCIIIEEYIESLYFLNDKISNDVSKRLSRVNDVVPQLPQILHYKIIKYIFQQKSTHFMFGNNKNLLNIGLASNSFFQIVCNLFNNYQYNRIRRIYNVSCGKWSFFSKGIYHLSYLDLETFKITEAENVFYQLKSLEIEDSQIHYQLHRDMVNLVNLSLGITLSSAAMNNLIDHCHCLETLTFQKNLIDNNLTAVNSVVTKLLNSKNKETLQQIKITSGFFFSKRNCDELKSLLQNLKNFELETYGRFKPELQLILSSPNHGLISPEFLPSYCNILFIRNASHLHLINPKFFTTKLEKVKTDLEIPNTDTQNLQLLQFLLSLQTQPLKIISPDKQLIKDYYKQVMALKS